MPDHLPEWITAIVVIAGVIYNSGILARTVKYHGELLKEHKGKHKEHYDKLDAHAIDLATLKTWHEATRKGW